MNTFTKLYMNNLLPVHSSARFYLILAEHLNQNSNTCHFYHTDSYQPFVTHHLLFHDIFSFFYTPRIKNIKIFTPVIVIIHFFNLNRLQQNNANTVCRLLWGFRFISSTITVINGHCMLPNRGRDLIFVLLVQ